MMTAGCCVGSCWETVADADVALGFADVVDWDREKG